MPRPGTRAPELALPVASLAAIRESLAQDVGADAAANALRSAGYSAGDALAPLLMAEGTSGHATFFRRLGELFAQRGWGHLAQRDLHHGVGMLEAEDWVEADPEFAMRRPSCFFTTGLLANLLGRAAGAELAVLEVECRSRGDARCRFLFGAPETLSELHANVRQGVGAESLVAALG